MLRATTKLKEHLKLTENEKSFAVIKSLVRYILKFGAKEDASFLLEQYINNASNFYHKQLLVVFRKFGDISFAEKICDVVIKNNKLVEDVEPEVLELMGSLNYEPIKSILAKYAFGNEKEINYYEQLYAVQGLLHFDCLEYIHEIEEGIKNCYNKAFFSEFLPALVCKLPNKNEYLEPLFKLGNEYALSDCNGGIVFGIALCGKEGKSYFKKILSNERWEAHPTGTGTASWAYKGFKMLNMSFREVYLEIKSVSDYDQLEYYLEVLFGFFAIRINDYEDEKMENFKILYSIFYKWDNPNESNNLISLAKKVDLSDKAYNYKKLFEMKMTEEEIIKNCMN